MREKVVMQEDQIIQLVQLALDQGKDDIVISIIKDIILSATDKINELNEKITALERELATLKDTTDDILGEDQ